MGNNENNVSRMNPAMAAYMESLLVTNPLMESMYRAAIKALQLPAGSHGLDAGCGVGLQALLLAEAVGPSGHVTGLDVAPEFLARGAEIIREAGFSERISFQEGSVAKLPFDDNTFDWVWSANCVGYGPWEPMPLLKELVRVVKPGGTMAILAWSSEELLPGYPVLEARLKATSAGIAPFVKSNGPEMHFLRALGWFRELDVEGVQGQTFAGSVCAPLNNSIRKAMEDLLEMRWPGAESELAREDRAEFLRLCKPNSRDFILDHPDYYAFFTCSMFWGKVR